LNNNEFKKNHAMLISTFMLFSALAGCTAKDGAYIALDELIQKHAPNIKKFYDSRPDVKRAATASDGKIYSLPFVPDGEPAEGWFIRKDWLTKLNLSAPKTLDEFYNVLTAFKTKDPNGNGKADEVPLFFRGVYNAINIPANLYGMNNEIDVKNGKIYYGAYEPEAIKYYQFAAKLYSEKLIEQEIFTRKGDPRNLFLTDSDTGGVTHDWFASTIQKADQGKAKNANLDFAAFLPPADINGKVVEYSTRETVRPLSSIAISKTNKYPVETIKMLDYLFTEEGRRLMNYGIEGVNYTVENGVPTFKPEMLTNKEKSANQLLLEI
jgi:putative aldouronate transport system substrate-binding protein